MKFSLIIIGAILCVIYFDTGNAAPRSLTKPNSLANLPTALSPVVKANKKSGNNSVILVNHSRVKRQDQDCRKIEHWSHRCRTDCECANHRYCSSYGFCHEKNRKRRGYGEDYLEADEEE